jgi:hypothetical protein
MRARRNTNPNPTTIESIFYAAIILPGLEYNIHMERIVYLFVYPSPPVVLKARLEHQW